MRFTQLFAPTLRDAPRQAELVSHKLLLRGGFIRPFASGVYSYLPLGLRVLNKISGILRQEMNQIGGAELLMPSLFPREILEESGRDKLDVITFWALRTRKSSRQSSVATSSPTSNSRSCRTRSRPSSATSRARAGA